MPLKGIPEGGLLMSSNRPTAPRARVHKDQPRARVTPLPRPQQKRAQPDPLREKRHFSRPEREPLREISHLRGKNPELLPYIRTISAADRLAGALKRQQSLSPRKVGYFQKSSHIPTPSSAAPSPYSFAHNRGKLAKWPVSRIPEFLCRTGRAPHHHPSLHPPTHKNAGLSTQAPLTSPFPRPIAKMPISTDPDSRIARIEFLMDIRQFILPGGVGLTHIKVYTDPAPDGSIGGGAHIHMVCAEIYYVLAGSGQIELLSIDGIETIDLLPHKAVFFRPGVFHRVLNPNKNLELLAIMQNGGLPERGDFVMSFPQDILTSPTAYQSAVRAPNIEAALKRRDLSLQGYNQLKAAFAQSKDAGQAALRNFYEAARKLIAPKVDGFEWVLKVGAQNEAKNSLDACDFIKAGRTDYLERSRAAALYPIEKPAKPGMCGELHAYALDETFLSEGRKVA